MPSTGSHTSVGSHIKVLIVEDQELILRGLLAITSSISEVTAEAIASEAALASTNGERALAGIDVTLTSTSTLMNAERQGLAAEHLSPLIVIVPTSEPQQLELATRRPAAGYMMQADLTPGSLRTALFQVLGGDLVIPGEIAAHLLNHIRGNDAPQVLQPSQLSSREAEVLTLLVAGASNKEIARDLRISVHGVKRHVSALLTRFNSPSRVHLVSRILRSGMALPPQGSSRTR